MRKTTLSIALILGAMALTGCSRNPVAPQVQVPSDPSTSSARGTQTEDPLPPDVVGEGGATRTVHVEANEAGVLQVGRWSLTIHKNSHLSAATIAMTVTDPSSMEVSIEVIPASANVFQVPIELVADCSDQANMVLDENAIFFWNGTWEQATDITTQQGSMLIKAKTNQLSNAKISAAGTVEIVRGRK